MCPPDRIDRVIASWRRVRPDLDVSPIDVIARMQRVRGHIDQALATVFARHGITEPEFAMLATLVRLGGKAAQHQLAKELALSPGTISVRVNSLVARGLATRRRDAGDARTTRVSVTTAGQRTFDACAPEHLGGERRLLSALTKAEQATLASLLRKLLLSFDEEAHLSGPTREVGLELLPAHAAIELRRAAGLPERAGLLVRDVAAGSPAAEARMQPGDVVIEAEDKPVRSIVDLSAALDAARRTQRPTRLQVIRGHRRRTCTLPAHP